MSLETFAGVTGLPFRRYIYPGPPYTRRDVVLFSDTSYLADNS